MLKECLRWKTNKPFREGNVANPKWKSINLDSKRNQRSQAESKEKREKPLTKIRMDRNKQIVETTFLKHWIPHETPEYLSWFSTKKIYLRLFHIFFRNISKANEDVFLNNIYIYIYIYMSVCVCVCVCVIVIVVGNGHGDTSSNPRRDWLHFTEH